MHKLETIGLVNMLAVEEHRRKVLASSSSWHSVRTWEKGSGRPSGRYPPDQRNRHPTLSGHLRGDSEEFPEHVPALI